jgi:predicted nucleic-acid-binding Zn-ribbon protein
MAGGNPAIMPPRACPRCGGKDLRRVDELGTGGGYGGMTYLAIKWGALQAKGRFGAYICRACGYTELFLVDPEDLDRL